MRGVLESVAVVVLMASVVCAADSLRAQRMRMVKESIEAEGVRNARVLDSMRTVPRHEFVPLALRRYAYQDSALSIGHRQTISPPYIVAYMTETIDPRKTDRVLEIGTGSGYQAAVLSALVRDVYTIEIVEPLGRLAQRRLKTLKYKNVHVRIGDGYKGWAEHAPFDKIIVTCSPENVPMPLVEQLKEGGRMLIPLGERYQQVFHLLEKRDGKLQSRKLIPALFVPMTGISEKARKVKPDPRRPALVNGDFEQSAGKGAQPIGWYYRRQVRLTGDSAPQGRWCLELSNSQPGRLAQLLQGFPVDGRRVAGLHVRLQRRLVTLTPGRQPHQRPGLTIVFFDHSRRLIGERGLGPWTQAGGWTVSSATLVVPARAREAILRVGLNGAVGRLLVDNVSIEPVAR